MTYPRRHSRAAPAAPSGGFWSPLAAGSSAAPAEHHSASAAPTGASGRPGGTLPKTGAAPRKPSGGAAGRSPVPLTGPRPGPGPGPDRTVRAPVKSCCLPATDDVRPRDLPPMLRTIYMIRSSAHEACATSGRREGGSQTAKARHSGVSEKVSFWQDLLRSDAFEMLIDSTFYTQVKLVYLDWGIVFIMF